MIIGTEKLDILFPEGVFEPDSSEHIVTLNDILPDQFISDLITKACEIYKLQTGSKYYIDEELILLSKDRTMWKSSDQIKTIDHLLYNSVDGVP